MVDVLQCHARTSFFYSSKTSQLGLPNLYLLGPCLAFSQLGPTHTCSFPFLHLGLSRFLLCFELVQLITQPLLPPFFYNLRQHQRHFRQHGGRTPMLRRLSGLQRRRLSTLSLNPPSKPPWLFIGLGNPGQKFVGTRHNIGFEMIDAFAEKLGISLCDVHCKALFGQGFVGDVPVFLAKPQTYMNLSGESTGPLAAYYKLPLNRVMVFHDDLTLPCGVLRLQPKGGHGSHNGLKSVIDQFRGNKEFARLRIGIGRPPGQMDPKAFLLQKFNKTARERIDAAFKEGVDVLKLIPSDGFAECARWFNKEQKYKHIRPHTLLDADDNNLVP